VRYFKLFSDCVLVEGNKLAILQDLKRYALVSLSEVQKEVVLASKQIEISDLNIKFSEEIVDDVLNLLVNNNFGFYTNKPFQFPEFNGESFNSPFLFDSAIVESDNLSSLEKVLDRLEVFNIPDIQLIIYPEFDFSHLVQVLSKYNTSTYRTFQLVIELVKPTDLSNAIIQLKNEIKRLTNVDVYNSSLLTDKNAFESLKDKMQIRLIGTKLNLSPNKQVQSFDTFFKHLNFYLEALNYNVGINKKIAVTKELKIKNHITHSKDFGNILEVSIEALVNDVSFTKFWDKPKDVIEKCKDCQFRYCCMSTSEVYEADGKLHLKNDCNYDPYNDIWD